MKRVLPFAFILLIAPIAHALWIAPAAVAQAPPAQAHQPQAPPAQASEEPAAQQPSVTLPPELARVLSDYEAAWSGRDAAALARLFAEDGFVLPNGGWPVRGRDAIQQHYHGKGGPLALRAFAFAAEGKVAYIIGGYAPRRDEPDGGKFTLTLRKEGGRWLIMSDMDSANRRPTR